MQATLYKPDGTQLSIAPTNGKTFTFEELKPQMGLTDDDLLQIVPLYGNDLPEMLLICDEEGKLKPNWIARLNHEATREWVKYYGRTDIITDSVVICSPEMID